MVNRIAKRINKQSFLNKVRIIYTLLVMLPVLVQEIFVLYSSTNFIKEQQLLEAKENIERNHLNIENQIKMCEKSVLYVTCNSVLREFLSLDDSEYKKRIQMTSNVNNLIYNAWLSNSYFSKMEVYSDKRISNNDAVFKKASDLEDNSWYEASWNSADTLWWNENGKYFITRRIAMSLPNRVYGVLRAEVKEKVFSDSISMFSEMPVDIQVKNGSAVLLEYNNEGEVNENSAGYEEERNLNDTGWKIIYRIDASYFSSAFHPRIIGSVVIVVLLLLLGFIGVNKSARSLLHYLYQIIDQVKKVKDGNFEIQIAESSQDEIGELAENINKMLRKIQTLIDEVYKSKLDKKSLELDLLQSKINPHFLYNTFETMRGIALSEHNEKVADIVKNISEFMRYNMYGADGSTSLQMELQHVTNYIRIMDYRFDDKIRLTMEIPEQMRALSMPKFTLQPIVENAVLHGFTEKRADCEICISGQVQDGAARLRIVDNGCGIAADALEKINADLKEPFQPGQPRNGRVSIGIYNVNSRLKLNYGDKYGVRIFSEVGVGTTAEIEFPAVMQKPGADSALRLRMKKAEQEDADS